MDDNAKRMGIMCCCPATIVLVIIILIYSSMKKCNPYKYCLEKNAFSQAVYLEGEPYEPGVHMIGFWKEFLEFPSVYQTISYSSEKAEEGVQQIQPLMVRAKNPGEGSAAGVQVTLEITIQYRRKKDKLISLFRKAMNEELQENIFISNVRAELTKVMSEHTSAACYEKRAQLIQEFHTACQNVLAPDGAECLFLQFYRMMMPKKNEDELVTTQLQKQQENIEAKKKAQAEVRAETDVQLAQYDKKIKEIQEAGKAERYNIETAAKTYADTNRIMAQAEALSYVKSSLSNASGVQMTDTKLAQYQQKLMLIADLKDSQLFYALNAGPKYIVAPSSPATKR